MPAGTPTSETDGESATPSTVGIIVNPHAGKDIRRLGSAAGHTSDSTKIAIVRRVAAAAIEQGAERVLLGDDRNHLAERAVEGLSGSFEITESPLTGSHLDSVAAATAMWKADAGAVVTLGGDGTCRDVATGWPGVPLIALSTGTNNVFPGAIDGTSAGVAAALVATGAIALAEVGEPAKRVSLTIDDPIEGTAAHEIALVEAALVDTAFVGARAVRDPDSIRWIIACIADPASTGLASIAGRVHPVGRDDPGGVLIRLGPSSRQVRAPITPGHFATVGIQSIEPLSVSTPIELSGGGIMAFDGERHTPATSGTTIRASVDLSGPIVIDAARANTIAAHNGLFDVATDPVGPRKDIHGN